MDIRQLHYFLTLCEEMNYTRAAQRLFFVAAGAAAQHCRAGK